MTERPHAILIDASGFAYRAFYSANPSYRADGLPTWAILGFLEMTWRLLGRAMADPPQFAAAVFDHPGKNFRHKLYPAYKAKRREARDDELSAQMPFLRHAAETLGVTPVEKPGFEADDIIATLATRARKAGIRTTIVSSDKDMCQLVVDDEIEIIDPVQRRRLRSAEVRDPKKFGVDPAQVPCVQALCGDAVDEIPGLPGIGLDRAAGLIRQYGSLEKLLAAVDRRDRYIGSPRLVATLRREADNARLWRKLALLKRSVPLDIDFPDIALQPTEKAHVMEFLRVLGATQRFEAMFSNEPQYAREVEAETSADPFAWWKAELASPGQLIGDTPQCGFYQRRLVRGGAFVPAMIWREPIPTAERDVLRCLVGKYPKDPVTEWARLASRPITEERYRFMVADSEWTKQFAPDEPSANPDVPINWLTVPI